MASLNLLLSLLLLLLASSFIKTKASIIEPMNCSRTIPQCNASLYHVTNDQYKKEDIASYCSVDLSKMQSIMRPNRDEDDYLISVTCTRRNTSNLSGYFYETKYIVQDNDTVKKISDLVYSGKAWLLGNHSTLLINENLTVYLPCGCSASESQIIVTYTVQQDDTPSTIASLLVATLDNMQQMNRILLADNPSFIDVRKVLFVPKELNGIPSDDKGKRRAKLKIVVGVSVSLALIFFSIMLLLIIRSKTRKQASKRSVSSKTLSNPLHAKDVKGDKLEYCLFKAYVSADPPPFESEKPVIFILEEIEEATNNFDETRIIGFGGYGRGYFGVIGEKEVAIKKMRSDKSKEFYAELKVLCRIHHMNVVELLGYASGEDYLYLVNEYVPNGSLSDHLHDPLLRGYQPLSWNARVQIALDAGKGLEYIHDYTNRAVKSNNIFLDEKHRAKIGEELQVTPKTDVFAIGVVMSELVTGKCALFRDGLETSKMKSLIIVVNKIFEVLENVIDRNLQGGYPLEDIFKMAELAERCLREDPVERPEMSEVVGALSQLMMSSME